MKREEAIATILNNTEGLDNEYRAYLIEAYLKGEWSEDGVKQGRWIANAEYYREQAETEVQKPELIGGEFYEGKRVTVKVGDKVYTRKVKFSREKWGDLYITVNGYDWTYTDIFGEE